MTKHNQMMAHGGLQNLDWYTSFAVGESRIFRGLGFTTHDFRECLQLQLPTMTFIVGEKEIVGGTTETTIVRMK